MTVIALGLNHDSAPTEVLGAVALSADAIPKALAEVLSSEFVNEAVVVSTCNRTEVYVDAERFHDAYHDVRDALSVASSVDVDRFVPHLYVHYHDDAVRHLFTVAAGLDSAILGEHEILGQLRGAWDRAKGEGSAGSTLNRLFQHAVACGKRVRTETDIGRHTASLSHAAVRLINEHRPVLDRSRVLLVGTGDVGRGVATALSRSTTVELHVANRTQRRAEELVAELGGHVTTMADLRSAVASADIVICSTAADTTIIDASFADEVVSTLLLDLAMPADIDPVLDDVPGASLLTLADLQSFANRGIERRRAAAVDARMLIDDALADYRRALSVQEIGPLLGSLHRWADDVRQAEIDNYRNRLGRLDARQLEAVEGLTRAVTQKVLHQPSAVLRQSAGTPKGDRLAESARDLFDLA